MKMGACSLQVTDTCTVSRRPAADPAEAVPAPPEDSEACYICFDAGSEVGCELVPSPCSCKKPVHRSCLSKWISTKGSRLCSICKGKLPIDFTVDAPFVVLQVQPWRPLSLETLRVLTARSGSRVCVACVHDMHIVRCDHLSRLFVFHACFGLFS